MEEKRREMDIRSWTPIERWLYAGACVLLPMGWGLGIVWAVAVDPRDHVWVLNQTAGRYSEQITKAGKMPTPNTFAAVAV